MSRAGPDGIPRPRAHSVASMRSREREHSEPTH
jgi:hypothetical protein